MAGWHHQLDARESEWTPGVGDGKGSLACCDSWGCRVGHDWATELNWTESLCGPTAGLRYSCPLTANSNPNLIKLSITKLLTYRKVRNRITLNITTEIQAATPYRELRDKQFGFFSNYTEREKRENEKEHRDDLMRRNLRDQPNVKTVHRFVSWFKQIVKNIKTLCK